MAEFRTGEAIWRNKDVDQPINIVEDLGVGPDGKRYVKIEGSSTGIPFDEIEYKAPKVKTTLLGEPKTSTGSGGSAPPPSHTPVSGADDAVDALRNKLGSKAADSLPQWAGKAGLILGGIVAAASVIDYGLRRQNEGKMHRQTSRQKREQDRRQEEFQSFDTEIYSDLDKLNGLPQQLYNNRNGHSNSWGGKRY